MNVFVPHYRNSNNSDKKRIKTTSILPDDLVTYVELHIYDTVIQKAF